MTDSMKFGPEWLRNLSQDNSSSLNNSSSNSSTTSSTTTTTTTTSNTTISMPRCQLAEYRYGREEMLALFHPSVVAPESLKQIIPLYVEKTLTPLLYMQWTDEETRSWNRGINSDVVLRVGGKGGQGPGGSISSSSSIRGGLGGRGGSVDRGRGGRARGFHYNRGLSYDDSDGNTGPPSSYSRSIRSFDRDRMQVDRSSSWTERNGGDMDSSGLRKDFGREMSWRRHTEEESWRPNRHEKWVRGGSGGGSSLSGGNSNNSNWREDWDREPNHRNENSRNRLWDEPNSHKPWDSDDLPEWATEKPSETGGTFDSSGAFHGTNSDNDDEDNSHSKISKQKGREDVHSREISSNNRVCHPSNSETNCKERNGPAERLESSTNKNIKDKSLEQTTEPPPLRQSHSTSSITNSLRQTRKVSAPSQAAQENTHPHPLTTSTSLSGMSQTKKVVSPEPDKRSSPPSQTVIDQQELKQQPLPVPKQVHATQQATVQPQVSSNPASVLQPVSSVPRPVPSLSNHDALEPEGMKFMQEEVAKLVDVDDSSLHTKQAPSALPPTRALDSDQWFYTDPQGEIQGPFSSAEMCEWYRSGYFTLDLMVRRADEQKFSPLGEQGKKYGKFPFLADVPPPAVAPQIPAAPVPAVIMPEVVPVTAVPRPSNPVEEAFLYQQIHLQNLVLRQQQALATKALGHPDWSSLSPEQQILMRASLEQNSFPHIPTLATNVPAPAPVPTPVENPLGALLLQKLQQAQAQAQAQQQQQQSHAHLHQHQQPPPQQIQEPQHHQPPPHLVGNDPHLAARSIPQPVSQKSVEDDSRNVVSRDIVSFMCQLQQNMALKKVDSVWSGPNPAAAAVPPSAAVQQMPSWSTIPPLWGDIQPKMKTEQEILEEQRAEEARKKEELRKQAEMNLKLKEMKLKEEKAAAEEERRRRKKAEEEEAEKKRSEEQEAAERKRKKEEEEAKRKEAVAKKAELEKKKEEEKKRKEEEKRKKEEEKRKKEEEKRKKEEDRRKLEEEKRKVEEEKKKQEEERKRKEEENRRAEQAREALKRLQEQAKVSPPWAPPPPPSTSLSEILKTERKQQQQLKEQQLQQQQQQLQMEAHARNHSNKIQLKWAEQKLPTKVKSLAEIQAEEQENLIAKQIEKEKERSNAGVVNTGSIWSGQNLTWNNNCNPVSVWGNNSVPKSSASASSSNPPFWDDVSSSASKSHAKASNKPSNSVPPVKANVGKTKTKKDEAIVMKLFEQQTRSDDFILWCRKALASVKSPLDIPTFVTFLKDIESDYEVREYIKMYLGEGKVASDFATQFIERRNTMVKSSNTLDNNTSAVPSMPCTNHFQEVKGKSKKPKKNKMLKVDNRILGFNVTAAHDRINVGDRDYGDGI